MAWADDVTLYAAASLNNALSEISAHYENEKKIHIKTSFASSSTLAKQIELGAPAEIFASADKKWMDYLDTRGFIDKSSRKDVLGNTLVFISPKDQMVRVKMDKKFKLAQAFTGKLCMGEPEHVPAGIYGKQALQVLEWWPSVESRVVGAEDVRSALMFVERGECTLGIVYETDASVSKKVTIDERFPESTHDPIIYPFALTPQASVSAKDFFKYLQGKAAKDVFLRYGFTVLAK
ncbi:MAG: molybdate ABC transporter substrate-binding protein [Aquirhabdus sp.]